MVELSRRSFFRGLVAAAVATQLVNLPASEAEAFIDNATCSSNGV